MVFKFNKSLFALCLTVILSACSSGGGDGENPGDNKELAEDLRIFRSTQWCNQEDGNLERWTHLTESTIRTEVFQFSDSRLGNQLQSMDFEYQMTPESLIITIADHDPVEAKLVDQSNTDGVISLTFSVEGGEEHEFYSCSSDGSPAAIEELAPEDEKLSAEKFRNLDAVKKDGRFTRLFDKSLCEENSVNVYVAQFENPNPNGCMSCLLSEKIAIIGTGAKELTFIHFDRRVPPHKVKVEGKIKTVDTMGLKISENPEWLFDGEQISLPTGDRIVSANGEMFYYSTDWDQAAPLIMTETYNERVFDWANCK